MGKTGELAETRRRWSALLTGDPQGVRLEFVQNGDTLVAIEADGALLVRARGGPIHPMGRLSSFQASVVPGWRAVIPAERHRAMLAGLREAEFPFGRTAETLVPDELPSYVTLEHRSGERATMIAFQRSVEADLALGRVVAELQRLASVVKAGPPTHRLPNPELDEWRAIGDSHAMRDDVVPEPTAEARGRAQASVERFYAEELAPLLRRVEAMHEHLAARSEQPRATSPPGLEGPLVAQPPRPEVPLVAPAEPRATRASTTCTFASKTTRAAAGPRPPPPAGAGRGARRGSGAAPPAAAARGARAAAGGRIPRALRDADAAELWTFDPEMIPFYCPSCGACFAAREWNIHERSACCVDGVCPGGHRRGMRSD